MTKFSKVLSLALVILFGFTACSKGGGISDSYKDDQFASEDLKSTVETIKGDHYIAVAAPLTGAYRELGKTILEGAELAVEDFNKTVGDKNKIGILTIDDGGLVIEGLQRADIAIAQNVLGVIGHLNSEVSIEASRKYQKAKIPQISPASSHPKFTERPNFKGYVFRTIGTDRQLGETAANYVLSNSNLKKVAVLYNDRPYGVSVAAEFVRNLAKDTSKDLVFYETIPVRTKDHGPTADKIAAKAPDIAFFVGEYNDAGYLLQELKKRLPNLQFLGAEGIHNPEFIKIAGNSSEGAMVVGMETLKGAVSDVYKSRFKKTDSAFVGSSYEATSILLNAIKANNFKNTEAIAKTIAGNGRFDPNGDLIEPNFVLYRIKDSEFLKI